MVWLDRVKQVVELVYATIREPLSTVTLPLSVARLLAVPREKLFKMVGPTSLATGPAHPCFCTDRIPSFVCILMPSSGFNLQDIDS